VDAVRVEATDRRRSEEGYNLRGAGRRPLGREGTSEAISKDTECRFWEEEQLKKISIICDDRERH
jgi:hypothetical protein